MEASRLHTRLPAPRLRSPGVLGAYLFASLALHGLVLGNQGTVGLGQSDAFTLDTMDPNPMVNIGLADSSGFELDTGGDDGSFRIGADESSGFILNTLDSPSSIDLTRAGFSDSGGFRLDTEDSTLGFVGTMDTGFADSSIFSLDTSGGNAVAWDLNATGYADSSGFQLDTRDDSLFGDSSFSDSAGFQLDTRETNEVVDRSYADSGSFQLDTGGHDGSLLFGFSDSGSFQLDTRNKDEVYNGDANTSFDDSSGFSLDTRVGDGGSNSTGGELVSVKGTIFYDGVVSGSAYVWAMEANGSKAAEDKISAGEGNYSILVEKGRAYDLKAFIDGNENGQPSTGEPWGHYGEWNNTANRYNLLQVDGNLTHVHFNLEDRDTDSSIPLTNLQLWLDGLDIDGDNSLENNPTAGTNIASWKDKSNNGYHAHQELVDEQPTVSENGGLSFNGIRNHLTLGSNYIFSENDGMTIFASLHTQEDNNSKADNTIYSFGLVSNKGLHIAANKNSFKISTPTDHGGAWSISQFDAKQDLILSFQVSFQEKQKVRIDGSILAEDNVSIPSINSATIAAWTSRDPNRGPITIGATSKTINDDTRFFSGIIREILVYNRALPEAEILQIESYLTEKWHNINQAPFFQSDGNLSAPENQTFVYELNASDPDPGDTLSYSILHGDDANMFELNASSGELSLTTPRDFESPDDNNSDNIYQLTVQVSDGENNATLDVSVTVLDVYEPSKANHTVDLNSTVNLEMIWVEPGTFTMGQSGNTFAEPEHEVTLTQGFYLGKYEVTQAQYKAVMTGNTETDSNGNVISATPSQYGGNLNRPVEKVSWDYIQVFLARLNDQQASNLPNGWAYVLPTEAQWEFACRAGTTTAYSWGDSISASDANWNHGNDGNQTENVGQYNANPWGFFDMHGNVWEWTADAFGAYASGAQTDPFNAGTTDSLRSFRGGGWNNTGAGLSSASRTRSSSNDRIGDLGFRVGFQQVPDTESPELELFGGADIPHKRDEPWAEPGFRVSDVRDGNLTSSVTLSGTVDVNTTGTYTLVYSVSDAAGNEANATRTVRVADESADTDGDGFNDYLETSSGSDVNDATSTPFNYGLVAWYPFDGNASDMSGNGNDLTGSGHSFGEDRHGVVGKSCRLEQVYLSETNASFRIDDNASFSYSLWVQMNSVPSAYPEAFGLRDATGNGETLRIGTYYIRDQNKFAVDHLSTGTNGSHVVKAWANQTTQIGRWYQITLVSSLSEVKLFIDSSLHSQVPFQRDAAKNDQVAIYVGGATSWNLFDGSVDDIRVYNRALSAEEIGMLYYMEMPKLDLNDSNFQDAVNLWFSDEQNATWTYDHISDWNTSAVTNMYQAFKDRASFNEDISKWDVSQVKNFSGFFRGAKSFNQNITNWDTSSATTFAEMFRDATSFNQAIGDWNVSSLLSLEKIFWSAAAFNQDLSNWDITGVNTMGHIFASADSLSEENKNLIHQAFSSNSNWPYEWGTASNQAPQFQSDGNLSVEENQAFIYDFKALDADGDVLTYSLNGGDDAALFELIPSTGRLAFLSLPAFKSPMDKNGDNRYEVTLKVSDSQATASLDVIVEVTEKAEVTPNQAPQFQSDGNLSVEENQVFIHDFYALDADGDVVTYSLAGGDDASLFELIPSTGRLAFLSLPAFKSPMDKNGDNRYEVTLKVSDGQATASLDVIVEVTEKAEVTPNQAPQFQSDGNLSVEENQAFIYNFNALDADGDVVSYSLASGDDKEFFKLNEATGGLSFIAPRDFEKPEDANVDNVYELTIEAGDSFKNTALVLRVEVLDVSEDDKGDPTDSVGFAPTTIEGLGMFARDDGWAIYEETVTFDELGRFHAVITNGYDNPVAGGDYSYKKTGEDTAELSYSVDGGFPSFKYLLTFISDLSGTYTKESDYGDALSFTSGPFSFKATDNNPNTGGGGDGGVRVPESLAGMEVEIHFLELMPNGDYEDLGMEVVKFGEFDVSAFDADSQQIEYEPYIYKKTSETTALITLGAAGYEMEEISLTFLEAGFAEGTWLEIDAGEIFEGTLSFRIVGENKHTDGAGSGDDGEPPVTGSISFNTPSFLSVQEKDVFVTHINASGVGGADPTYSLLPGADSFFFELSPVTGKLSFRIPRDFHHPEDANLDNLYEVTIEASDGENSGFLDLVVGIFEIKEDPTDPGYPGGPGMDELVFITPDYFEVEENMNYIAQVQASGLGGYSISYSLNGGLDQKFFEIDPFTGDLRFFTTRDFDHPEDANQDNLYELSIKASDGESSAVLDLVVGILDMTDDPKEPGFPSDVLLPIVYTNLGEISESGEIHLSGRVLHDGGGKVEEVGFFLSPRLRIDPMGPETVRLPVHTEHDFYWLLDESPFPKRLYIQAYAINEAGMNRGAIKRIKIPEPPMFWWGDVKEREGGWSESSWFGSFKYYDHGWLFHSSLQWLFSSPVDGDGVWLWKDGMNWLWTGENIWPYMWSHDRGDWIYVTGGQSGDGFIFYDYSSSTYRDF